MTIKEIKIVCVNQRYKMVTIEEPKFPSMPNTGILFPKKTYDKPSLTDKYMDDAANFFAYYCDLTADEPVYMTYDTDMEDDDVFDEWTPPVSPVPQFVISDYYDEEFDYNDNDDDEFGDDIDFDSDDDFFFGSEFNFEFMNEDDMAEIIHALEHISDDLVWDVDCCDDDLYSDSEYTSDSETDESA